MSTDITTITLSKATKKRIDDRGKKGETHNEIVSKLLDQADPPKTIEDALSRLAESFERLRSMRNEANVKAIAAHRKADHELPEDQAEQKKKLHGEADALALDVRAADNFVMALAEKIKTAWAW